jgi:hypothetical protein
MSPAAQIFQRSANLGGRSVSYSSKGWWIQGLEGSIST